MKPNFAPIAIGSTPAGAMAGAGTRIRIMIADDHEIFRDGVRNLLSRESDLAVVSEARTAGEALAAIAEQDPDILLLDLGLPDLNVPGPSGLSVLQKLQVSKSRTRVIVLTNSEDREQYMQALRLGISGIIQKKTPTELLIKSIRKVYCGEIWLDRTTTAEVMRQFAAGKQPVNPRTGEREREASPLSNREREIVGLVSQGFKNKEMAEKMFISEQTVKNHLHNIFDKLGVSDRLELALYAIHKNLHEGA